MVALENLRVLQDYVVVKKLPALEEVRGILVPEAHRDKPLEGIAMAVGPGCPNKRGVFIPTTVKVGQRVLLPRWHGKDVKALGEEYAVIAEPELLAVWDDEEAA